MTLESTIFKKVYFKSYADLKLLEFLFLKVRKLDFLLKITILGNLFDTNQLYASIVASQ